MISQQKTINNTHLTGLMALSYICLPLIFLSPYNVMIASMLGIYTILLMGLNLLTGYNGQLSLGHGAFFAIGAYTSAFLFPILGNFYPLVLPIAAFMGLLFGFSLGCVALKLHGPYLGIATFALAVGVPSTLLYFESWTGGYGGLLLDNPPIPNWPELGIDQWMFIISGSTAVIMYLLMNNLIKNEFGKALVAIRDNPIVASTMGINVNKYKIIAFAISVMYAAIAGSLIPLVVHHVSPTSFEPILSIQFLAAIIVGGVASRMGPIYGAIYLQYIPNIATAISLGAPSVISGLLVILIIILSPGGINGMVMMTRAYIRKFFFKPVNAYNENLR